MTVALPRPRSTIPSLAIVGAVLGLVFSLSATSTANTTPLAPPATDFVGKAIVSGLDGVTEALSSGYAYPLSH